MPTKEVGINKRENKKSEKKTRSKLLVGSQRFESPFLF